MSSYEDDRATNWSHGDSHSWSSSTAMRLGDSSPPLPSPYSPSNSISGASLLQFPSPAAPRFDPLDGGGNWVAGSISVVWSSGGGRTVVPVPLSSPSRDGDGKGRVESISARSTSISRTRNPGEMAIATLRWSSGSMSRSNSCSNQSGWPPLIDGDRRRSWQGSRPEQPGRVSGYQSFSTLPEKKQVLFHRLPPTPNSAY